jgi:hypothetical protein
MIRDGIHIRLATSRDATAIAHVKATGWRNT